MTNPHAYAIIMAGGKGERFWPLSTTRRPKQLLALAGGKPLILQAIERLDGVVAPEHVLIVTNRSLVDSIRAIAGEWRGISVLGEPVGRDTAAAIAAGAAWIKQRDPEAVFCVMTADHLIGDLPVFRATLENGMMLCAEHDILLTIGIAPTEASSAYGYIEAGEPWKESGGIPFCRVRRFVEKPDAKTAREYLATGRYAWNSGMFVWSVRSIQSAFQRHRPALAEKMNEWSACPDPETFQQALERDFPELEKISIDYAVMEKADNIVMCKGTFVWDDVGSWTALESHLPSVDRNSVSGDVVSHASEGNIVFSPDRLTALVGVKDLIVVQADGVTLVCSKARAQEIKGLLATLRTQANRDDLL